MEKFIYEIKHNPINPAYGASYKAHGVREGQRIQFMHDGNLLYGCVAGCVVSSLILEVDILSY